MSIDVKNGVHGYPLIRTPDRTNTFHFIEDVYLGDESQNNPKAVNIPNVGDLVLDRSSGYMRWLEVVFVDEITLTPMLTEVENKMKRNEFSKENQLLGIGPGYQSETWRLFLDKSVVPHVYAVDSRLHIYGKENMKYKIFLGTDTSKITGKVISMNFNSNGELLSEDLPLEKVIFPAEDTVDINYNVKHPRKGFTTTNLENGDVVTLVTYTEEGHATSYNTLLVHNTALDRNIETNYRYVISIGLDSPFLDKTEDNTLIFPMNIPRDALALMGVVHYNDGTTVKMPIDGKRLVLHGLDNYVPMKRNQSINLVLTYNLPSDEMALNSSVSSTDRRFISRLYFGRTQPVDGSYSVNLYPIPTYVDAVNGWRIRYILYTLDRDVVYDVTPHVRNGATTEPFNPSLYNETQDITVSLDLSKVNTALKKFTHVQSFKINLANEPNTDTKTAWYITYEKDQNPIYGGNIICRGIRDPGLNRWRLDIRAGAKSLEDWLDRLYYRVKPMINDYYEKKPMKPTHFAIHINETKKVYPLKAWDTVIDFSEGAYDGYGIVISWIRVEGSKQYQLACSPVCFIDVSEGGVIDHGGAILPPENVGPVDADSLDSTVIDVDYEIQIIRDRGASEGIIEKYRHALTRIKQYGLLRYDEIHRLYRRIKTKDLTPGQIANDVLLLEIEVNKITLTDFNRNTESNGIAPVRVDNQSNI